LRHIIYEQLNKLLKELYLTFLLVSKGIYYDERLTSVMRINHKPDRPCYGMILIWF